MRSPPPSRCRTAPQPRGTHGRRRTLADAADDDQLRHGDHDAEGQPDLDQTDLGTADDPAEAADGVVHLVVRQGARGVQLGHVDAGHWIYLLFVYRWLPAGGREVGAG